MEYYSALKEKKILSQSTTWMNLEEPYVKGNRSVTKDKYCVDSTHMQYLE